MGEPLPGVPPSIEASEKRLDSWKEIAAYLNRDVTTVQRWEKREGMPVHRHVHDKRGSVYALNPELDAWLQSRGPSVEEDDNKPEAGEAAAFPKGNQGHRAAARAHRWLALAAIAAAGLLAAAYLAYRGRTQLAAQPMIKSLAVLPLKNLSGDATQEYFADGMTEALITDLGKIRAPRVISRQSVMRYKDSKKPLQEIARELNVDAVLEGAVQRSGDRVRVSMRLEQVSPESQLWANQYNRDIRDVLRLQDEIARTVTDEIQIELTSQERALLSSARSVDPEAHDDYLRGRYQMSQLFAHWNSSTSVSFSEGVEDHVQLAIGYFKQAIQRDPAYALPYAGLADAYLTLGSPWGPNSPRQILPQARAAATKALQLDPSLGEVHFSLAEISELYDWNWPEADQEYRTALKLSPNDAELHLEYGRFLQAVRRDDEVFPQMEYAMQLDPFDPRTRLSIAYVTYSSRQYDLASKQFESLQDHFGLGWAYREKKMYPEAIAALHRSLIDSGRGPTRGRLCSCRKEERGTQVDRRVERAGPPALCLRGSLGRGLRWPR
jgi:TolB-like protein